MGDDVGIEIIAGVVIGIVAAAIVLTRFVKRRAR
jgi:hypothetical protein